MNFRERLAREIHKAYEELTSAGVFILAALFCLALVLFLAILTGVFQ